MEITFEDQRPDENVIFALKRHPWVLASGGFITIILIVILVVLFLWLGFSLVTGVCLIVFVVFLGSYLYYLYFAYSNYLYILTDQRIIVMEQKGLFSRRVTEAELAKVQNVTVEVKGPVRTILNFGDVVIRTAGMEPQIILNNVDNPYRVQQKIVKFLKSKIDENE